MNKITVSFKISGKVFAKTYPIKKTLDEETVDFICDRLKKSLLNYDTNTNTRESS